MKKGAYPTKFPNCPSYLSKKKPAERSSLGFSVWRAILKLKNNGKFKKNNSKLKNNTKLKKSNTKLQNNNTKLKKKKY